MVKSHKYSHILQDTYDRYQQHTRPHQTQVLQ